MVRVWLVIGVVAALLYIYSIVDCALAERDRVRGLPKAAWVPIVIVFPLIGAILWFAIGRPRRDRQAGPRTVAPDDDPDFLRNLERDRQQQERIRRLERELSDLDDTPKKKSGDTDGRRDA
ncbi:PLD nuclease N-terminal domain-containing protein [Humibacter sp. RRB41]|uniref:PLD nuclease N-terminal domain-containing protein n=1 Tax=Humibacter sp. RRB41 TaxID=2919946 RepID=UPI001FAAB22F|nr:PLD nuclease N-terminal domain-containing protein [Humibacter sp. RRB41]